MISARTAFQVYKEEEDSSIGVSSFNALPPEVTLPFKVRAAEEVLVASLQHVDTSEVERDRYAVSVLHAASTYLTLLASFLPLMARSQSVQKVAINYVALARTMAHYGTDVEMVKKLKELVVEGPSAEQFSITVISDLEGSVAALEKAHRQTLKETGAKAEILRKVAPERQSPPQTQQDGEEEVAGSGTSPTRKRRSRSKSAAAGDDEGADSEAPLARRARRANVTEAAGDGGGAVRRRAAGTQSKSASQLVWGRLRALTPGEKKAVAALKQVIDLLAHVYATRCNELVPVFDHLQERVRDIQAIIDTERASYEAKEDKKPPEPFHDISLDDVRAALATSVHTFRDDEECRYDFDEDLVHPIAHACLTVVNQVEGYSTTPLPGLTEKEKAKKLAARAAAKTRREEAQHKALERVRAREELANKRAEDKRLLRQRLGEGDVNEEDLVEDCDLVVPAATAYVHYAHTLPLGSVELFEKALFVWAMISSVPRPLLLSQMPFSLFLRAVEAEDQNQNGLMEEITRCLVDVSVEHLRVSSPSTPRIMTRGKNWFDALVEFVGVASGNKKRRQQQQRKRQPETSSEESDDSDSSDDDDDDEDEESSSATTALSEAEEVEDQGQPAVNGYAQGHPVAAASSETAAVTEDTLSGFERDLKETMNEITELRGRASWGNIDPKDRLNLLQFCVQEALGSEQIRSEAESLIRDHDERHTALDKRIKEIREEAEKELKSLAKPNASAEDAAEYEKRKRGLLDSATRKRQAAIALAFGKQDGHDVGAVIHPLGMDRYRRLYWHFPMERVIHLQTTAATAPNFPLLPVPAELLSPLETAKRLLDDDDEGGGSHPAVHAQAVGNTDADVGEVQQCVWGTVPAAYLPTFVSGLDVRGEREAPLRKVLQDIAPYLETIPEPQEGRVTRARSYTFGYINNLKEVF